MSDLHILTITDIQAGKRLDKVLADSLPDLSRSRLKALIEDGHVSLDGDPQPLTSPKRRVKAGEVIHLSVPEAHDPDPKAEDIPLDVVYEDMHLIVVNKAPGMVVHPAPGAPSGTLVNALLYHCAGSLSGIGGVKRPGIVHRIDKDTSGLLVMAKHDKAHTGLAAQFADHSIERIYMAVCRGHPVPLSGRVEGNIARHPQDRKKMAVHASAGKWAATHYKTLQHYMSSSTPLASLIECQLETGRTHQVRVHMTHIGHPLIGDPVYGRAQRLPGSVSGPARAALQGFKRQALHARRLGFVHPVSGEVLSFDAEPPHDMSALLEALDPFKTGGVI